MEPVLLENHPRWGLRIIAKIGKKGNKFDGAPKNQTKQCAGCQNLRAVISTKKTGYAVSPERLSHIIGICTWSTIWKIVWQSDKPRKCTLVPSYAGVVS